MGDNTSVSIALLYNLACINEGGNITDSPNINKSDFFHLLGVVRFLIYFTN
jgi:hypothetical protein